MKYLKLAIALLLTGCATPAPRAQSGLNSVSHTAHPAGGHSPATFNITGTSVTATAHKNGRPVSYSGRNMEEVLQKMKADAR